MTVPSSLQALLLAAGEREWEPHPFAPGLDRQVLLSRRDHGADVSIFLFRANGNGVVEVPEHVHEEADDISFLLAGSARITIAGGPPRELLPGSFVRVPKGVRHRVFDVSSDFQAINLFTPAIL